MKRPMEDGEGKGESGGKWRKMEEKEEGKNFKNEWSDGGKLGKRRTRRKRKEENRCVVSTAESTLSQDSRAKLLYSP